MEAAIQSKPFTSFQIEMLEMVSRVSSEVEMQDIRRMLGQYFAKRAEDALDRLWDEGVINEGVNRRVETRTHAHTLQASSWTAPSRLMPAISSRKTIITMF